MPERACLGIWEGNGKEGSARRDWAGVRPLFTPQVTNLSGLFPTKGYRLSGCRNLSAEAREVWSITPWPWTIPTATLFSLFHNLAR